MAQVRLAEDAGEADEDVASESYAPFSSALWKNVLMSFRSAFTGLKLALKDPKVYILAVMSCAQLLGLGYANFFPTYVVLLVTRGVSATVTRLTSFNSIAGTLGFSTTVTLLLAAYVTHSRVKLY